MFENYFESFKENSHARYRRVIGSLMLQSDRRCYDLISFLAGGASSSPCSETHAGSAPFSEPEMKSLSEYIKTVADKFYVYISFHSYSQLLLFPYGHTTDHLENHDELVRKLVIEKQCNSGKKKLGMKQ